MGAPREASVSPTSGRPVRSQPHVFPALRAVNEGIYRLLRAVLTVLMGALIVPVTMQIASRYTSLIPHYIWTEEVARFCFIWIVMIGAVIAVHDGTHFDLDVLHPKTPRGRALLSIVVHGSTALVALTFLVYGWPFALFGWQQHSELTGISMLTIHVAWPFAGATMLLFTGERLLDDVRALRNGVA